MASILQAIAAVISAVAWPGVVVFAVVVFRRALISLLSRDDVSLSGPGGFALVAKRREASAQDLVAADAKSDGSLSRSEAVEEIGKVESAVRQLGRRPRVLWVDDRPSNNRLERASMERLGIDFELAVSTEDALALVSARGPYDVIISDMGRPEGDQAGYDLLKKLRDRQDQTPFIIYALSRSAAHFDEAVRRGAVGCTNRPGELVDMVTKALRLSAGPQRDDAKSRRWGWLRAG